MLHLLVIQLLLKVLLGHQQACLTLLKAISPVTTTTNIITALQQVLIAPGPTQIQIQIVVIHTLMIIIILLVVIGLYRGKGGLVRANGD